MASITIRGTNITNSYVKKIKTNYGNYAIPVLFTDVNFNIGDKVTLLYYYQSSINHSVIKVAYYPADTGGRELFLTLTFNDSFIGVDNEMFISRYSSSTLKINETSDSDYQRGDISYSTGATSRKTFDVVSLYLIVGANGVVAFGYGENKNRYTPSNYTLNGFGYSMVNNQIGYCNISTGEDEILATCYGMCSQHALNIYNNLEPIGGDDPYSDGGTSTTGGGGGDFNNSSDTIDVPTYDATQSLARQYANRGFTRVYTPTEAQVTSLHSYLWSSNIDSTLKKMFSSPMQSIVSLAMLPVTLDSQLKTSENIHLGGVDTEIECTKYPYQFVEVDCGSLTIPLYWRSYLDYSPHTKLQIYLPYIGMQTISIDDFIDATIGVKYIVDIVSGDCVCFISRTNVQMLPVYNDEQPDDNGVIYTFTGNCALKVPVSAADYSSAYAAGLSAISAGVGLGLSAMTGGLTAPAAVGSIMATATNVSAAKERVQRGGSIPSTLGWMGIQKPYLIITRPIQCVPDEQYKYTGYPAYVTRKVSECVGYAEFEEIHLEGVPATDSELVEIENMLKQGVIINV